MPRADIPRRRGAPPRSRLTHTPSKASIAEVSDAPPKALQDRFEGRLNTGALASPRMIACPGVSSRGRRQSREF